MIGEEKVTFNLPFELNHLYKDDRKLLRTGTIIFGHLYEDRWQTHIQRPLDNQEIKELEEEYGVLPNEYKEFLSITNGCYLFDLLRIAGKQDGYKGMSREEQTFQPISLRNIEPYLGKKELPTHLFVFADSMIKDRFYAFNQNGHVLEINERNLKTAATYPSLEELLKDIYAQGKEMVLRKEYIEF